MFELNANIVVIGFALLGALSSYFNARKAGVPVTPALKRATGMALLVGPLSLLYLLTLNALQLRWNSLSGYGLGLAFGFAGLLVLLSFKSWRDRRGDWR